MTSDQSYFEDEIDLREIAQTLLRYKWFILGLTIIMALGGYAVSKLLLPKQYQAAALVVITKPILTANLDPRIQTSPQQPDIKSLTDLTKAGDLVLEVYQSSQVSKLLEKDTSPDDLRAQLNTSLVGTSQLRLEVTDSDPDRTAQIANAWADAVTGRLNKLFDVNEASLERIEQQVQTARQEWDKAEQALLAYLPNSQEESLKVSLAQQQNALRTYLDRVTQLNLLISDAQVMEVRLSAQDGNKDLLLEDGLSLITLQQRAVGELAGLQIQVAGPDMLGQQYTVAEAAINLRTLITSLKTQHDELQASGDELKKIIPQTQSNLESAHYQMNQLTMQRDLALNAYQALNSQVEETHIALTQNDQVAKIAGQALPPERPTGPRASLNGVIAGALGLLISVLFALITNWWKTPGFTNNDPEH
jgi:uncharacterized protein involved in exopolysaccharide biosynthesis